MKTKDQIKDEIAFKYYACSWVEILREFRTDNISMATLLKMEDEVIEVLFTQQRNIIKEYLNKSFFDVEHPEGKTIEEMLKNMSIAFTGKERGWQISC